MINCFLGYVPLFPVWNNECADCVMSVDIYLSLFVRQYTKTYEHVSIKDSAHVNFPFEIQTSKDSLQTNITKCIILFCPNMVKLNILKSEYGKNLMF